LKNFGFEAVNLDGGYLLWSKTQLWTWIHLRSSSTWPRHCSRAKSAWPSPA